MEKAAKKQREIIEDFITAYNDFDVEAMLGFVHEDIVFRNICSGEINAEADGLEEFRSLASQSKTLFSSRCQRIKSFRSEGDTAFVEIEYEAVLSQDFPNGMKTGDTLRLVGRSEYQFHGDKILRIFDYS